MCRAVAGLCGDLGGTEGAAAGAGVRKALALSKMELGEFVKEVVVCREVGGWSHRPAGSPRAATSTGAAGTLRGGKSVASVTGGVGISSRP